MPVTQLGALNTTALLVPNVYVQIVPPQTLNLNGVPSNIVGLVGSAEWGPVGSPVIGSSMAEYARTFGAIKARKFDLGTITAIAVMQGAQAFRWVRVTDGTDVAAEKQIMDGAGSPLEQITYTSKWTGSGGNSIRVTHSVGSNSTVSAPTYKVSVAMPGRVTETFDNIGGEDEQLWVNIQNAINLGQSGIRGPSEIITAAVPTTNASDVAPTVNVTHELTGGTDGAANVDAQDLIGVDTVPRKGMYALRGTRASIVALADCDDSTTWSTQVAYGLSEGAYMILAAPAGQTVATGVTAKSTAGIDSYAAKLMLGDWVYFLDTVNGQTRLVSPQGFVAGLFGNLAPQHSSLNKQLYGIVGTEKSLGGQSYSQAELQELARAGIDVIANPSPGGTYFSCRIGHNSSSNPVINGDNYTRMTNYIAYTLDAGMGLYIGRLQSRSEQRAAKSTLETFFSNMEDQGQIGNSEGTTPFKVTLDISNNPQSRVALGYMQADCQVQYLGIIEKFLINVEGGVSVQISRGDVQAQ